MAIMQDWAVTLCKIAKMQDGIKVHNNADQNQNETVSF